MKNFFRSLRTGALALSIVGAAVDAVASQFAVTPVRIELSPRHPTETIALRNQEASELRFSVVPKRWTMDAGGHWLLVDADDLIVHPRTLVVPPGQTRLLRAGTASPRVDSEVAYRIEISEQPAQGAAPATRPVMQVLTRMSLPVFIAPAEPAPKFSLASARLAPGALDLSLKADGNVHLGPQKARLLVAKGVDPVDVELGYLLPGASIELHVPLTREQCPGSGTIMLSLHEPPLELKTQVPGGAAGCGS
jgi:fimbrial chaperone protein